MQIVSLQEIPSGRSHGNLRRHALDLHRFQLTDEGRSISIFGEFPRNGLWSQWQWTVDSGQWSGVEWTPKGEKITHAQRHRRCYHHNTVGSGAGAGVRAVGGLGSGGSGGLGVWRSGGGLGSTVDRLFCTFVICVFCFDLYPYVQYLFDVRSHIRTFIAILYFMIKRSGRCKQACRTSRSVC